MTRYQNINELDARIEKIIKKTVEYYYSDWKNYDRPKYMRLKGSKDRKDKELVLIVRDCGTYLFTLDDIENSDCGVIYEYYYTQDQSSTYYYISLDRLTISKIDPATFRQELRKAA